jgi:hypothetical protein
MSILEQIWLGIRVMSACFAIGVGIGIMARAAYAVFNLGRKSN